MSNTTIQITAPISNPTWYGNVRDMFNATDKSHMRGQGIDLANYNDVVNHAGDIYQQTAVGNMPPGSPWSSDYVATFLNWMTNGYPKGTPNTSLAHGGLRAAYRTTAKRLRKEVTALSSTELQTLHKAFAE